MSILHETLVQDYKYDFTVIIPSFNKGKFVERTLLSIIEQDESVVQVLFVDGGSSDDSVVVARRVFAGNLACARAAEGWSFDMIVEPDQGQSHAINKGLLKAQGRIVCWLNADDYYYPGALKTVKAMFHDMPNTGMIYGGLDFVDSVGERIKTRTARAWNRKQLLDSYCYIPQPSTFWRHNLIPIVGLLDVTLYYTMDYDYWLRISRAAHVAAVQPVFAAIRIMEGTKTGVSPLNAMPEALRVGRRHGARYLSKFRLAYWLWSLGAARLVRSCAKHITWE